MQLVAYKEARCRITQTERVKCLGSRFIFLYFLIKLNIIIKHQKIRTYTKAERWCHLAETATLKGGNESTSLMGTTVVCLSVPTTIAAARVRTKAKNLRSSSQEPPAGGFFTPNSSLPSMMALPWPSIVTITQTFSMLKWSVHKIEHNVCLK